MRKCCKNIFIKFIIIIILLFISTYLTFANEENEKPQNETNCRTKYLGFSTGKDNPSGILGFDFELPSKTAFSFGGGVGISSWGLKIYTEGKYYLKPCHKGWAFGAGLTYNTGQKDFKTNQETTYYNTLETIHLELKPQANFFLAAYKYWRLGENINRIFLEMGVSVPLSQKGNFIQKTGDPVSANAASNIQGIAPGGLIVGLGLAFH